MFRKTRNVTLYKILLFLLLTFLWSLPGYALFPTSFAILLLMWGPGFAAFTTQYIYNQPLLGLGWPKGQWKWLLLSILLPLLYALITYSALWQLELISFNKEIIFSLKHLSLFSILSIMFMVIGSEIGWRGFLVIELNKICSYTTNCFITGLLWSIWYFPVLIYSEIESTISLYLHLSFFTFFQVTISFILGWLRLKSKNIWTTVAFRTSQQFFIFYFLESQILSLSPFTKYFVGETGLAQAVTGVFFALFFWGLRHKL